MPMFDTPLSATRGDDAERFCSHSVTILFGLASVVEHAGGILGVIAVAMLSAVAIMMARREYVLRTRRFGPLRARVQVRRQREFSPAASERPKRPLVIFNLSDPAERPSQAHHEQGELDDARFTMRMLMFPIALLVTALGALVALLRALLP
jgi:hypothetical protein